MSASVTTTNRSASAAWQHVWRSPPSTAKDETLLTRERASKRWALIVERLERTFGSIEGITAVEMGSGRGDLSALLAERGAKVTLVDSCGLALDQARARFDRLGLNARFESADFLDSSFAKAGRYDVALSSGVIEHFQKDDRTRSLRAHSGVLSPGGLAIVSVPHALCLPYRLWKLYLELRGWWPYGVEIPYTKRELVRRARDAGFVRTETHCTSLLQSIGTHWVQRMVGVRPGWSDRDCPLDSMMGFALVLFGWVGPDRARETGCDVPATSPPTGNERMEVVTE